MCTPGLNVTLNIFHLYLSGSQHGLTSMLTVHLICRAASLHVLQEFSRMSHSLYNIFLADSKSSKVATLLSVQPLSIPTALRVSPFPFFLQKRHSRFNSEQTTVFRRRDKFCACGFSYYRGVQDFGDSFYVTQSWYGTFSCLKNVFLPITRTKLPALAWQALGSHSCHTLAAVPCSVSFQLSVLGGNSPSLPNGNSCDRNASAEISKWCRTRTQFSVPQIL